MVDHKMKTMEDKSDDLYKSWLSPKDISFVSPEAEKVYKERVTRIVDAIQLKRTPDRVPITPTFSLFPALDNGMTCEEAMYNYDKLNDAWKKTMTEFEPDAFTGPGVALPGPVLDILDYRQIKWPGHGVSPYHIYQFVEKEYVTADEFYNAFVEDPSDFMLRVYLPRLSPTLKPFEKLRPIRESMAYYMDLLKNFVVWGLPEYQAALDTIKKAGAEALQWATKIKEFNKWAQMTGFPLIRASAHAAAPYDVIGDFFRGTNGVMTDMYRRPEKLLEAQKKLVPILIKMAVDGANESGNPVVSLELHKGAAYFMSDSQFKDFYWPGLRDVMIGLINEGIVPMPLFEGDYTPRLEVIKEIPKGKAIYWFETVDRYKAKEILGDTVCFKGNVPVVLLNVGTPQDVKDNVKELIDVVGKGGGLIVDCGIWFDEAKHENVKAMIDFTKEYGVYR
jgi:hypothetical protein